MPIFLIRSTKIRVFPWNNTTVVNQKEGALEDNDNVITRENELYDTTKKETSRLTVTIANHKTIKKQE